MAGDEVRIVAAGGMDDGAIGTDATRIMAAIWTADAGAGVVVTTDLGSAVLSASTALDLLDPVQAAHCRLSRGLLVEGAIIAAIQTAVGDDLQAVCDTADAMLARDRLAT
jgi:dihydroxyacetone kinase DhaKLM complex PTS-EIIA-like component DhaM